MTPLPLLDWPPDLFAAAHAAAAATREPRMPTFDENNCACGCNQRHNRAVSAPEGDSGDRRMLRLRSMACKNTRAVRRFIGD